MATTGTATTRANGPARRMAIAAISVAVLVGVIALDTTVVKIGSDADLRLQAFDPNRFGQAEFPRIREYVVERAPEAQMLAEQLGTDKKSAIATYGTMAGAFPIMTVRLTGTLGEGKSGIFDVDVQGLPDGLAVRVQTGPAINGTELRDIPGDIEFGAFKNQIEYQDAGAGINRAMATEVLEDLERNALTGRTVTVTGAFTLINPKNWLITPVALEVK